jgi:hypothetical protein
MDTDYRSYRRGSFFFPIALITLGVVWLLVNNGTIPMENVYRLIPFWPVLIILAGLSLLFRRAFWPLSLLIWGGAALLVVWLLTYGSAYLPQTPALELKHETFTEPVSGARSAKVTLDLSINRTTVSALENKQDLISADVYYAGEMRLRSTGTTERNVRLIQESGTQDFLFNPRLDQWASLADRPWTIGLTPAIPLDLTVDASTGSLEMDLSGLQLDKLDIDGSTGSLDLSLPTSTAGYPVRFNASTGSAEISVPDATAVTFNVDASTGRIIIDVPDDASVRLRVTDGGTGGLNLPDGFVKVSGDAGDKEGTYESASFSETDNPILITLDMSTGSFVIR